MNDNDRKVIPLFRRYMVVDKLILEFSICYIALNYRVLFTTNHINIYIFTQLNIIVFSTYQY